ncbi:MAG: DUF1302 domain-containing protein [Candidatus Thiodiazotropha sp.]
MLRSLSSVITGVCLLPLTAHALQITAIDDVSGYFDTTISYGASWRTQDRDSTLVGTDNGGKGSINRDDGNLNYDKGDLTASLFKVTHELDISTERFGLFARGYYFYDFENADRTGPAPTVDGVTGEGYRFGDDAEDRIGSGYKILDAYIRADTSIADRKTQVRLGNQVLSWGESSFITNGINVINPVDLARLRSPGSELKEALLPTPMLSASQDLSTNISVEGFVIGRFRKIELDPRGSFFSTTDIISDDGDTFYLSGPDQHFDAQPGATQTIGRGDDRDASDSGEFGLAMRFLVPQLGYTEFGAYYLNYHHRAPIVSARRGGVDVAGVPVPIDAPTQQPTTASAQYFVEYPEDVHLTGLSFNTSGPFGTALAGEYSYRSNLPLQVAAGEVLLAGLGLQNSLTGGPVSAASVPVGTEIQGYRRVKAHQAQMSMVKAFSGLLDAGQIIAVGEVGFTYLDLPEDIYFAGYGETTPAGSLGAPETGAGQGFATRSSWGYQLSISGDYNNAIGAVRLSPRIAFSHGVRGVSPTWNEGVRSLSLGLSATLKDRWRGDLGYTAYFGGRVFNDSVNTNSLKDRDFISASLSYAF